MKGKGVDVFAVSIQNEPDISVFYEFCDWNAVEMTDFLKSQNHYIESNVNLSVSPKSIPTIATN